MTDIPTDLPPADSMATARERGRRNIANATVGIIASFAVIGWFVNFYFAAFYDWNGVAGGKGEFGDIFGVINSLFTGLAFIGVVWSVYTQREELRETRKIARIAHDELKNTQKILDKQEENISQQNAATTKQMFEATFFQLFESFNVMVSSLSAQTLAHHYQNPVSGVTSVHQAENREGKEVFELFLRELEQMEHRHALKRAAARLSDVSDEEQRERIYNMMMSGSSLPNFWSVHNKYFETYGDELGIYFRNFYTVLSFIDRANIEQNDKYFYSKLIRARMSPAESAIVALNSISGHTTLEFNFLLIKYGMAKNGLRASELLKKYSRHIPHGLYGQALVKAKIKVGDHPTTGDFIKLYHENYEGEKSINWRY